MQTLLRYCVGVDVSKDTLQLGLSVIDATGHVSVKASWPGISTQVSILLPNKAKHYLQSLGYKSKNDKIDAQGLSRMGLEQQLTRWQPLSKNIYARAYEADYVAKLAELAKKTVPTGGTTQDQEAEAVLSCV